jgi:hypothetical protein
VTERPQRWPAFTSPIRSTALTARVGSLVGICFLVCLGTGLLSHYQYRPWSWLPEPASPVWLYRFTQGVHVATGMATIPLVLVKLWSVYPNLFRWPPMRSVKHALERLSIFVLVSTALIQLTTGFLNALNWYPWPWDFVSVHRFLGYVVVGSILLHVGVKLPDIVYGWQAKLPEADVLTEIPWSENPNAHSNACDVPPPATTALSRRGVLVAAGAGIGTVVLTSVGQTVTPLEPLGLLAIRQRTSRGSSQQDRRTSSRCRAGAVGRLAPTGRRAPGLLTDPRRPRGVTPSRGGFPHHVRGGVECRRALAGDSAARGRQTRWW